MKRYLIFGAISTVFLLTSCNKELTGDNTNSKFIPVSITISPEAEATLKSGFDKEKHKIVLTGSENMSIFYNNGEKWLGPADKLTNPYMATGSDHKYSFNCPAELVGNQWFPIFPYSDAIVRLNSAGSQAYVRLSQVQFPEANSFDPQMDYLLGMPFTPEPGETDGTYTAEVSNVKRLFTPLRFDFKGLADSDKISAVTVKFKKDIAVATKDINDALTGTFYVKLSDEYDNAVLSSVQERSACNAVSAIYNNPLEHNEGVWPVWFIVNSVSYAAGTEVEITVTTQDAMYVKTFTLGKDTLIGKDVINYMGINMATATRLYEDKIVSTTAMGQYTKTGTGSFTDADGVSTTWNLNATAYNTPTGTTVPRCIQLTGTQYITFPDYASKKIVKALLYTNPFNQATGMIGNTYTFTLDESTIYSYNLYNTASNGSVPASTLAANGGVLEISLGEGEYLNGKKITSDASGNKMISAITLIMEEEQENPKGTDYYLELTEGKGITIAGTTYIKNNFTNIVNVTKADGLNQTSIRPVAGTIYFLDDDVEITFTDHLKCTNPYYIVGRYSKFQPVIRTAEKQIQIGNKVVFKNINIVSDNANNVFQTGSLVDNNGSIVIEDCEISCIGSLIYDSNVTYSLKDITVNNSIISQTTNANSKNFLKVFTKNDKDDGSNKARITQSVTLKNNVFVKNDTYQTQLVNYNYGNYSDLKITVQNNTLINLIASSLVQWNEISNGSVTFDNNVGWANGNRGSASGMYMLNAPNSTATPEGTYSYCSITNNYFVNHDAMNDYSHSVANMKGVVKSKNTFIKAADATDAKEPVDVNTGVDNYYPVKDVAAGKGASYNTKLWMQARINTESQE